MFFEQLNNVLNIGRIRVGAIKWVHYSGKHSDESSIGVLDCMPSLGFAIHTEMIDTTARRLPQSIRARAILVGRRTLLYNADRPSLTC